MKKVLLISSIILAGYSAFAQNNRYSLIEEFSGENCGPCAIKNPAFWTKISAPGNDAKVLLLKYQSPIPSAGPIYLENTVFTDARMEYYEVPFAPYARINGSNIGSDGDIANLTQAMIDAAYTNLTPFTIEVDEPEYNPDGQRISVAITVTATTATTATGVKLRVALAEHLEFDVAPGSNGETEFHNVVRQMYPDAGGLTIDEAWTAGQTRTYTVEGAIPSYVKPSSLHKFFAAWLQKESSKEILQAGRTDDITITLPSADAQLSTTATTNTLFCATPATVSGHSVTLKNTGTSTLTTAKIYYRAGTTAAWSTYDWAGSLAAGAEATVALPDISITDAGTYIIYDSVALPNGKIDYNTYDNLSGKRVYVLSSDLLPLPVSQNFEAVDDSYIPYASPTGYPFYRYTGSGVGYDESGGFLYYPLYGIEPGTQGYNIMPKADLVAGDKTLEFYVSYAQITAENDKLEVVYSTDCGDTWTSVWSKSGNDLKTAPPNSSTQFIPANNDQWRLRQVDVSDIPANSLIAFKVTCDNGNGLFVDNVLLRTGKPTSIDELFNNSQFSMYPNPVNNVLNVEFDALSNFSANVTVMNVTGQTLYSEEFKASTGNNKLEISTGNLPAGNYLLNINTEKGSINKKFSKK